MTNQIWECFHVWKFKKNKKKTPFILLMFPSTEINWAVFLCDQQKICPDGQPTSSAHPARFSPDDKFSRHRVTVKKRFGLLLTQQPRPILWERAAEKETRVGWMEIRPRNAEGWRWNCKKLLIVQDYESAARTAPLAQI